MNQAIYQQYEAFQEKRKTFVSLIREIQGVLNALDMTDVENTVKQLETLVLSDSFKVLVIGEFKRGKSTSLIKSDNSTLPTLFFFFNQLNKYSCAFSVKFTFFIFFKTSPVLK